MGHSLSLPGAPPGGRDTSWAARYGQAVLAGGIATLPQALFAYQGALALAAQEVWFIAAVLAQPGPDGQLTLSLKALAEHAHTDLKWLRELRGRLEAKAYLVVT